MEGLNSRRDEARSQDEISKLHDMLSQFDHDELLKFREALRFRRVHDIVDDKIRAFNNPSLVCPVCERSVSEQDDYVLLFGPRELRRKARFCGTDCLVYFLNTRSGAVTGREDVASTKTGPQANI